MFSFSKIIFQVFEVIVVIFVVYLDVCDFGVQCCWFDFGYYRVCGCFLIEIFLLVDVEKVFLYLFEYLVVVCEVVELI